MINRLMFMIQRKAIMFFNSSYGYKSLFVQFQRIGSFQTLYVDRALFGHRLFPNTVIRSLTDKPEVKTNKEIQLLV